MASHKTDNRTLSLKALCIKQLGEISARQATGQATGQDIGGEQDKTQDKRGFCPVEQDRVDERIRQTFNGEFDKAFYPAGSEWTL